ncbi:MAG: alpha/beta hydrolase [Chloroflexota bacterium]
MTEKIITKPEWGSKERIKMSDGASLVVRQTGSAEAQTILCLARHGGNGLEYSRFAKQYGDRFHIVAIDRRGHGESDFLPEDQGYSIQQFASDLIAIIDELELKDIIGIGVSMGGGLLSLLNDQRPGLLRAAILVDIGPETRVPDDMEKAMVRMQRLMGLFMASYGSFEEIVGAWRNIMDDQWPNVDDSEWDFLAACTTFQKEDGRWYFGADIDGFMTRQPAEQPPDYWPSWKNLSQNIPTMLVFGELSNLLSPEIVERMIKGTEVELVTVPGIGHYPIIDNNPVRDEIYHFILRHQ